MWDKHKENIKENPELDSAVEATYVHGGVDLGDGLVIGGKLVDLNSIADQLASDFELELGQLTLGDGVRLGDDWNNVYLQWRNLGLDPSEMTQRATKSVLKIIRTARFLTSQIFALFFSRQLHFLKCWDINSKRSSGSLRCSLTIT